MTPQHNNKLGHWVSNKWYLYRKVKIKFHISTWQDDWNGAVVNKIHSVKPVLGDWQSSYRQCRKDEVVLCRARIGHTYMTHSYILNKDPPPQCERCQCILTERHILVECNHLAQTRNDIFGRWCGGIFSIPP